MEPGKVVEAVSLLNCVTHSVAADISPDISQLILELTRQFLQ